MNKKIVVEFTNERIIPASGLAVVGAILGKSDFVKQLNRMDVTKNRSQHQIKNRDILLTYIGQLCMGKPDFHSVCEFSDDPEFTSSLLGLHGQSLQKKPFAKEWMTLVHPCRAAGQNSCRKRQMFDEPASKFIA